MLVTQTTRTPYCQKLFMVLFTGKHTQTRGVDCLGIGMSMAVEYNPEASARSKGVQIIKPVVHGNIAKYFGKNEEGHTHRWKVYLRSYENDDMSGFIKKVQFKLHDSYTHPVRMVTAPPYEITETGWGEFEISIKVFFYCPNEKPVSFHHHLKLFKSGPELAAADAGVVSEVYDEIIFQDPTQLMQQCLATVRPLPTPHQFETDFTAKAAKTLDDINKARVKVKNEIMDLRDKLQIAKDTISKFKNEIVKAQTAAIKPA